MIEIINSDCLAALELMPSESVHCCVTSPPYWGLRDYQTGKWVGGDPDCEHRSPTMQEGRNEDRQKLAGSAATNSYQNILAHNAHCGKCGAVKVDQQIGLERSCADHIEMLVRVFAEVRRVLRKDGTLWLNYGDAYATAPNGRSAAESKSVGGDDRTFRDKPMSTIGGVFKAKDRMLLPARVAIALQESGWWVRDEIIWHKPNPMPSSVKDRTTPAHEMIYLLAKSPRYYLDPLGLREAASGTAHARRSMKASEPKSRSDKQQQMADASNPNTARTMGGFNDRWNEKERKIAEAKSGIKYNESFSAATSVDVLDFRNKRSVWTVPPKPFADAHFATFPPDLIEPCIIAGCPPGGTVLDPFFGAGTTGLVAERNGRNCIGIELSAAYVEIAKKRLGIPFGVFA